MADFLVRHALNPNKVVKFGITFRELTLKDSSGDPKWLTEIKTDEFDYEGNIIPSYFINTISLDNIDLEIEKIVSQMVSLINWNPLSNDTNAPYISFFSPNNNEVASISSNVEMVIMDDLPSSGIDIGTIVVKVNGVNVTEQVEISGNPYRYTVIWQPPLRVHSTY